MLWMFFIVMNDIRKVTNTSSVTDFKILPEMFCGFASLEVFWE